MSQDKIKFLQVIDSCGIFTSGQIQEIIASSESIADAGEIAQRLVGRGLLTPWQARYLLKGRSRLKFRNYILLDRTNSNRLCDSFIAKHVQLDRLVKMVFLAPLLSVELTKTPQLMKQLTRIADLNHPHLEHIHEIDFERGRYILVMDHMAGQSLNTPKRLVALTPSELQGLLKQTLVAVAHLHQHDIQHGSLSEASLMTDGGGKAIVCGMALTMLERSLQHGPLRTPLTENKKRQFEDCKALSVLGQRLVARLESQDTSGVTAKIGKVFFRLSGPAPSLAQAIQAMEKISADAVGEPSDASEVRGALLHPQVTSFERDSNPITKDAFGYATRRNQFLKRAGQLIVGAAILAAVYYFGTLRGFGLQDQSATPTPSTNLQKSNQVRPDTADGDTDTATPMPGSNVASNLSQIPTAEVSPESASPLLEADELPPAGRSNDDALSPDANPSQNREADAPPEKVGVNRTRRVTQQPSPLGPDPTSKRDSGHDSRLDEPSPNAAADAHVLEYITLPDRQQKSPETVYRLDALKARGLELKLITDENIARKKVTFLISSAGQDRWTIALQPKAAAVPQSIARFTSKDGEIQFSWLAAAENTADVDYLRNCILELSHGQTTKLFPLRAPIYIESFVLQRSNPHLRVVLPELEFLPRFPYAQLGPLQKATYGSTVVAEGREDWRFTNKKPLDVLFNALPEYQLLSLHLACELKNRSVLEAELRLLVNDGERARTASEKNLEAARVILQSDLAEAERLHALWKETPVGEIRAQLNLSLQEFKNDQKLARVRQLQHLVELSKKRDESFRETRVQLEPLFEKPIPVSIYFEVDKHRVLLATTTESNSPQ